MLGLHTATRLSTVGRVLADEQQLPESSGKEPAEDRRFGIFAILGRQNADYPRSICRFQELFFLLGGQLSCLFPSLGSMLHLPRTQQVSILTYRPFRAQSLLCAVKTTAGNLTALQHLTDSKLSNTRASTTCSEGKHDEHSLLPSCVPVT